MLNKCKDSNTILTCVFKSHSHVYIRQGISIILNYIKGLKISYKIINLPVKKTVLVLFKSPHVYKKFKHKHVYKTYKSILILSSNNEYQNFILMSIVHNLLKFNLSWIKFKLKENKKSRGEILK
jgi:ribosomal protein S10